MAELPKVSNPGSSGEQQKALEGDVVPKDASTPFDTTDEVARGLASSKPSALGSIAGSQFTAAIMSEQTAALRDARREVHQLRAENSISEAKRFSAETEAAVLRERNSRQKSEQLLSQLAITAGSALFVFALSAENIETQLLPLILGGILAVCGWALPRLSEWHHNRSEREK